MQSSCADSFRGVREYDHDRARRSEDQYGFRPVPGVKSVAEQLAHIAVATRMADRAAHRRRSVTSTSRCSRASLARGCGGCRRWRPRSAIVAAFGSAERSSRRFWKGWGSTARAEGYLPAARCSRPKSGPLRDARFRPKEHEMHHRAQLMVCERCSESVPHLTRRRAAMADAAAGAAAPARS